MYGGQNYMIFKDGKAIFCLAIGLMIVKLDSS